MSDNLKPHEQYQSLMWGMLWYLLPLSYIIVDRFLPYDGTIDIYSLVIIQGSITCGMLYWGINKFAGCSVRKTWIWTQAFGTVAIFQLAIGGIRVFKPWIDISLHVVLPILWFFTFYKLIIASSDINPSSFRIRSKSK